MVTRRLLPLSVCLPHIRRALADRRRFHDEHICAVAPGAGGFRTLIK